MSSKVWLWYWLWFWFYILMIYVWEEMNLWWYNQREKACESQNNVSWHDESISRIWKEIPYFKVIGKCHEKKNPWTLLFEVQYLAELDMESDSWSIDVLVWTSISRCMMCIMNSWVFLHSHRVTIRACFEISA